jgi:hypothetical protein
MIGLQHASTKVDVNTMHDLHHRAEDVPCVGKRRRRVVMKGSS